MSATPLDLGAQRVLALAAELDAAEAQIKEALLAAAKAGDSARVITIIERWLSMPTTEVLRDDGRAA